MKRYIYSRPSAFSLYKSNKIELNNYILNFIRFSCVLSYSTRQHAIIESYSLNTASSNLSSLTYGCIVSGKNRNFNTNYKLSNLIFKSFVKTGLMSGFYSK